MPGSAGFDDPLIPFDDPATPFDGTAGPPANPVVTGVAPNTGPDSGGTSVTVTGTDLAGATAATVGGTLAAITSNTGTTVVLTTPAHLAGVVNIQITTAGGTSAVNAFTGFTYTSTGPGGAPTVTGMAPNFGPSSGGTRVTVIGTNMSFVSNVVVDGISCTPTLIDPVTIQFTTPAHPPGRVDVRVRNPSGLSGVSGNDVFTYNPPTPPLTRSWGIFARDGGYVRRAQIEDFTACTFLLKDNDVGSFQLTVPYPSLGATWLLQPQAGIVIEADGDEVFSGPGRGKLRQNENGTQSLVFSGVDDNFWLLARQAHPQPATPAPPYGTTTWDIRTGRASTVLSQYVNVNLGPAAIAARRINALTVAPDPLIGSTITGRGRWQPLLTFIQPLALASSPALSFRILQSGNALVFSIVAPVDRSHSVVFSVETGTLGNFDYERTGANANYIYGGGAGHDAARLIVENEDGDDINEWGRVEEFLSRSDISSSTELAQAVNAELLAQTGTFRTDLSVIDTAGLSWPNDYGLGDITSFIVDGVKIAEKVRAIQVDLGPNGDTETVTPSVSSPSPKATVREKALFALVRDLRSRVSNIERNQ